MSFHLVKARKSIPLEEGCVSVICFVALLLTLKVWVVQMVMLLL